MNKNDFIKYRHLARTVKKIHINQLLRQSNIVGMGFGQRTANGQQTDEPAVVIYVMKKISKAYLPSSRIIPRKIFIGNDCIDVDVVETGPIHALSFTTRDRPAPAGISIGHVAITAGTLGGLVRDLTDGATCILSNNHVLANQNAASIGDHILQPGPYDGGVDPADQIGTLKRFQMIDPVNPNEVDAAIASVNNADVVNEIKNNLMPVPTQDHPAIGLLFAGSCNRTIMNPIDSVLSALSIEFLAGKGSTVAADIGMNVEKVGRTTEYTTSTVKEIDATVTIGYDFGSAVFDNQITTAWLSEGGDSGSVVCRGGNGGNEDHCSSCGSTSEAARILGKDLTVDRAVEKGFRQHYLSKTMTGRYAIQTYFDNEDRIIERVRAQKISEADREYFRHLYDKYADTLRKAAINIEKSEERVTKEHIEEAHHALGRISQYLDDNEREAAQHLFELGRSFEGRNAEEILRILDDKEFYNRVVKIVSTVKSLRKKDCC